MNRHTGTPSSFSGVATDDVLAQLEFPATLELVAGYAAGPLGARAVQDRRPITDPETIGAELEQVSQLAMLLRRGDGFRPDPVSDLEPTLQALSVDGAVLDGPALADLRRALEAMQSVAAELARVSKEAFALQRLRCEPPPRDLAKAIGQAIEADGSVKDAASPEVSRARQRVREMRERLVAALEAQLRSLAPQHAPAGATVTLRSGRYVIPINRDARGRVGGIIHGESGSGATLFVEPAAAVEQGNDLAEAEAAEARAIQALFRSLTGKVRPFAAEVERGWLMCIAADDLSARARAAVEWNGQRPVTAASGQDLAIVQGRHPLLLAELGNAVPFDLELSGVERSLVISGPNTGGKTVLLKAIGLLAMLAQSGIIPPVGDGTTLPVFDRVFADIGDRQSIAESLSTFSAHLRTLRTLLAEAGRGSLVLIDELGSGTDPNEGAALAAGVLLALLRQGSLTVATTHLSQLKELATTTPGVVNASLRFDGESMQPTYELIKGVPGRSYGLAIARRLGLPERVLEEAEARRSEGEKSVDALLASLEAKSSELTRREQETAEREESVSAARQDLEALRSELEARVVAIDQRSRELERSGREQAREFLLQARKRVEEALGLARAAVSEASAREARRLVEEGVQAEAEAVKKLREAAEKKGWSIKGDSRDEKRETRTTRGETRDEGRETRTTRRHPSMPPRSAPPSSLVSRLASPEVDLRGMTGDEAESALNRAVDDAILGDLATLRVIHGKGTGALRQRVTEILKRDGRVAAFRLAPAPQGGSGVTIVEFRP